MLQSGLSCPERIMLPLNASIICDLHGVGSQQGGSWLPGEEILEHKILYNGENSSWLMI